MFSSEDNQVILYKENFKKVEYPNHYSMIPIDSFNFMDYKKELMEVSKLIQEQLSDWEKAPTYSELEVRFLKKSKCVLFLYNNYPIGWGWYNNNVKVDWIHLNKELPVDWVYGGGLFVSRLVERPKDAGMVNYNRWLDYIVNELNYNVFCGYCHKWNKPAMNVHLGNGLIIQNWC